MERCCHSFGYMLVIFYNPWWTAALEQLQRTFFYMTRIPQTASISHGPAVHVTGKDRPNTTARYTQESKAIFARDGSQWPQVPLDLGSCSFKFIQVSALPCMQSAMQLAKSPQTQRLSSQHGTLLPQLQIYACHFL